MATATKTKTKRPMLKKYVVTVDGTTRTVFSQFGDYDVRHALPRKMGQSVSYSVRIERLPYGDAAAASFLCPRCRTRIPRESGITLAATKNYHNTHCTGDSHIERGRIRGCHCRKCNIYSHAEGEWGRSVRALSKQHIPQFVLPEYGMDESERLTWSEADSILVAKLTEAGVAVPPRPVPPAREKTCAELLAKLGL